MTMFTKPVNFLFRNIRSNEFRFISSTCRQMTEDSNNDNDQKEKAVLKLNLLLQSIIKEEQSDTKGTPSVELPKPRVKQRQQHQTMKLKRTKHKNLGEQIVGAAQTIAQEIEGDQKETEAQLLHKLLYKETPLKKEILKVSSDNEALKSLLSSMKIQEEKVLPKTDDLGLIETYRADQVRSLMGKPLVHKPKFSEKRISRVNLFGENSLGIFKKENSLSGTALPIWELCHQKELRLSVSQPPTNYYEQMINWTDKGLVWKFPINNEQGLEEEKKVSFADHVFLELHLEDWCPHSGPIRHFMELVCVGLSRNHWLSAAEKKNHILWYRDFFLSKKELIKELGAGDIQLPAAE